MNGRLENLTKLNKQKSAVITQKDTLEKADKKFSEEYKKFSILEQEYRSIRDKFFASSSYNLAKDLKDGMPCPVCGSKAHPSLAVSTDVVSEVDFKSAENNYENKQKLINNLKTSLDSERSAFKEKVNQMIQVLKDNGFADANESMIYSNQLDDLIKTLSQQICDLNQWNIKYESTQKDYVEKSSKLNQELKNQKELLNQLTNDLDENKKNLSNRIEENKLFKNIEQIKELDGINIEKTKENIERFNNEKLIAKTTIDNTPKELVKNGLIDASQLAETVKQKKEIFDGCISAANDIKNKLTNLSKSKRDIKTKYDECKDVLVTFSSISELSKTANGFNRMHLSFKMYILADYFDKIIIQANRRLKRITNGRYKLIRRDSLGKGNMQQGLDLDVYDVETGKNRPASSLSGGEKFVSALSMALGLSDIIETNHALIQVESIFIDEGFGSLDENYLDMAMKALETLKDDNKTVAIISHVEKLKEYISDGLEVKKTDIGSTVYLKENC
ncbi:MAG: hypothetical protein HUJ68_12770 [Clostridia bacterium]|nr:hypothetical protein [Clostridia bacterium]